MAHPYSQNDVRFGVVGLGASATLTGKRKAQAMGFFNKPATDYEGLALLSNERIKASLEGRGWSYRVDDDGEISGAWDEGFFYFLQRGDQGEILHVRGAWFGKLTTAEQAQADAICAEWNRTTLWPKAFTVAFDDGAVRVIGEHTVDYEFGLTDKQLSQHLLCAVNTGHALFEKMAEAFPEQAKAYREE